MNIKLKHTVITNIYLLIQNKPKKKTPTAKKIKPQNAVDACPDGNDCLRAKEQHLFKIFSFLFSTEYHKFHLFL